MSGKLSKFAKIISKFAKKRVCWALLGQVFWIIAYYYLNLRLNSFIRKLVQMEEKT
jgi:hypothetical protein